MRSFLSDTLPEGWVAATLGEVSILNPQRGDFSNIKEGDDVSFIPMSAVDDVAGTVTSMQSRPFREVQRGFTSFIEGDILFAKITPCMENGKTAIATNLRSGIGFGSTEFHVLRTVSPVTAKYVYYFLRQTVFREAAKGHMTGTGGLKRVPAKWLSTHPIPLPPLSEQSRIGVKLDAAMQEAKAAQSQLADGFASVVNMRHQALTGACSGKLTSDWRLKHGVPDWGQTSIGDLSSLVTSGSRGWAEYYSDAGPLFIRAQNISDDCLDLSDVAHVMPPQQVEGARTRVAKNDLLITITGGNVAKTGLVETELEEAYVSQHVALVRLQDFRNARFLFLWLRSPEHGRGELLREAQHSDKPGLSLIAVRNVKISLPSHAEQEEIFRRVEAVMMQADTLEAALNWTLRQSEENMQAAFDQAFRGELVPTEASLARAENRAYENAGVLLERIQAEISLCKAIPRPKSPKRVAMKTLTSDILKVCIAGLPQDTFTFAELQRNSPAKYDELQKALFELLDEPQPIVRQVFNKKEQKMQFQRLIP